MLFSKNYALAYIHVLFIIGNTSAFPGLILVEGTVIQEVITSKECTVEGMGIRVSIPQDSLSSAEEPLTLQIHPCFSGPFELPEEYESASPAYLIKHSRRVEFQEDVEVIIHHYACLESEEDCDDMVFLSASATPEFRESGPVYVFKEIKQAKGVFKPGYLIGEITLRHFCLVKVGKRKRTSKSPESSKIKKSKGTSALHYYHVLILQYFTGNSFYYSARLYRSLPQNLAVFCMCLYHQVYTKVCISMYYDVSIMYYDIHTAL